MEFRPLNNLLQLMWGLPAKNNLADNECGWRVFKRHVLMHKTTIRGSPDLKSLGSKSFEYKQSFRQQLRPFAI